MDCISDTEKINSIKQSLNISSLPDIHVCKSENNTIILRAKYRDEAELQPLFEAWEATWRISRTHPKDMSAGIKNLYYKEFHCQHSDLRISAGQFLPHDKHCGCQAHLTITIKKIGKRCLVKDPHLPSYPTIIKLFNQHNHALDSADALKCKDVSTETKNKFHALFENGHSPYSALQSHQMDLQNQYGEDYYVKATDRSLCPDLNWCYKLFHDICEKLYGEFSQDATEVMLQKLSKIKTDNNV